MNQTDLKKGMEGRDALDNDVAALLSALPRVEAPGNFEFGVRAKIAAGESAGSRWSLLTLLKVTAPLALLLVVTAIVFLYGTTAPIDVETVAVGPHSAEAPAPVRVTPDVAPNAPVAVQPTGESQREVAAPVRKEGPLRAADTTRRQNKKEPSEDVSLKPGSRDIALGSANTISPPGFKSLDRNSGTNANAASITDVPIRDVLGILGLTVEFGGGASRVRSVAGNSLAAHAGMKSGDVIETIDGRGVNADTKLKGDGAKSFVIRRDRKRLTLKIGN